MLYLPRCLGAEEPLRVESASPGTTGDPKLLTSILAEELLLVSDKSSGVIFEITLD
jgi:hypothetical protein